MHRQRDSLNGTKFEINLVQVVSYESVKFFKSIGRSILKLESRNQNVDGQMHRQMEFGPQYVTFKISYAKFQVKLSMDKHSTYNIGQIGGCLIKICKILIILQIFYHNLRFSHRGNFSMEFAPQYLTFNMSYKMFLVKLSIDE